MMDARAKEWLTQPSCTVAQAAKMLGMSGPGVIRAIDRGEIHGTRIGKRIIIPTGQLRRILMIDDEIAGAPKAAAA